MRRQVMRMGGPSGTSAMTSMASGLGSSRKGRTSA